ncbi:MAG: nitrate reductase molybdenum cofactor assembly chaperone [Actinobacteria bacterium]|nr:nitrate reductase molybdenum cofactor assembly chaperone [Actinomycetota bacterium]
MIGRKPNHEARADAWRIASALLRYPDQPLVAALPAIREAALAAKVPHATEVAGLIETWLSRELIDLETEYVEIFDLGRSTSLYLTWHQYGDRRQRGLVLSKLKREYMTHGMNPVENELPDWLPLMLEFAATAPEPAGVELLEKWRAPIEMIRKVLHEQNRPQAVLLDLVSDTLPKLGTGVRETVERLLAEGPPEEEVGLEPFGPDSGSLLGDSPFTEVSALTGGPHE